MTRDEVIKHLEEYTMHETIYKTYFLLPTEKEKEDYLNQLKCSEYANESLWLPGFFDLDNTMLSERSLFSNSNKNIIMQKHNRFTPARFHQHEFFEMIYVYSGSAEHEIQGVNATLTCGDLLIIAPSISHSLSVFDDSIVIDALIQKGTFLNYFFEFLKRDNVLSSFFQRDLFLNHNQPYITFHTYKDDELEHILFDMFIEYYTEDDLSDNILNNLCMIYFAKLVRRHQTNAEVFSSSNKENTQLLNIITYIQNNYTTATLTSVARHFHYAPAYLSNYIKEHTGENFIDLVKNTKLLRAEYLLSNSNLSVQDICVQIGYESAPHFIRLFKEKYGVSPSKYRKSHINPY